MLGPNYRVLIRCLPGKDFLPKANLMTIIPRHILHVSGLCFSATAYVLPGYKKNDMRRLVVSLICPSHAAHFWFVFCFLE